MAYPPQAAQKQIFPNPHFMPLPGHHCRCLAELRESAVDAINYCSRQLLVPWSIVRHTTWHAPSPFQRLDGTQRHSHAHLAEPIKLTLMKYLLAVCIQLLPSVFVNFTHKVLPE